MKFNRRQNTNLRQHIDRNTVNDKILGATVSYPAKQLGVYAMGFILNIIKIILSSLKYDATILRTTYHRVNQECQGHDGIEYEPIPKGVHVKTLLLPVTNIDVDMPPT